MELNTETRKEANTETRKDTPVLEKERVLGWALWGQEQGLEGIQDGIHCHIGRWEPALRPHRLPAIEVSPGLGTFD